MADTGRKRATKTAKTPEPARAKTTRRRAPLVADPPEAAAADRPVVLVVDDDADVREWLRLSLSLDGWTVEEASNGDEAVAQWRATTPDVVLLDHRLGGKSGLEVAAELRALSSDTRIMLVTAHLDEWATKESRRLRLLPLEKIDHERLFQVLAVLAEQIKTAKTSKSSVG